MAGSGAGGVGGCMVVFEGLRVGTLLESGEVSRGDAAVPCVHRGYRAGEVTWRVILYDRMGSWRSATGFHSGNENCRGKLKKSHSS